MIQKDTNKEKTPAFPPQAKLAGLCPVSCDCYSFFGKKERCKTLKNVKMPFKIPKTEKYI
jgi:hypothetical protein